MKLVLIDNYDSFTYNVVECLRRMNDVSYKVMKVDAINYATISESDAIFISPGPGLPQDYPQLFEIMDEFASTKAIFGLCLGHQLIGNYYGGSLVNLRQVFHGRRMQINILDHNTVFRGLPSAINVGRYHSWVVEPSSLPEVLLITAEDENGNIMALKHRYLPIEGVQFHPESYMTSQGRAIITNFLNNYIRKLAPDK